MEHPVTIEQASKIWKLQQLIAGALFVCGALILWLGFGIADFPRAVAYGNVVALFGLGMFVVGMLWMVFAGIGSWWNHG